MKRILLATTAALTLLLAGTPALAGAQAAAGTPAVAADGTALDAAKKLTTARIDGRLATLKAEGTAVKNAVRLTDGHQSTLEGILSRSTDGLTALRAKVQTETTLEAVKADTQSMINDCRIYLLVTPQVRLTIAADVEAAAIKTLEDAYATLAAAIETAEKAGKQVTAAKEQHALLRTHIEAAKSNLAGVADGLLTQKPGPDASAIRAAVTTAKSKVRTVRSDLHKAAAAAKATRDLLK